jgi:hypothetical protein
MYEKCRLLEYNAELASVKTGVSEEVTASIIKVKVSSS